MSSHVLTALLLISAVSYGQDNLPWRDQSPHRVRFVTVDDGVRLETLDWGGQGPPLVLLAGYLTAHAYDKFAPKLTAFAHVYGITRRGLGASSRPESGHTAERSAEDVLKVLDELKLAAPVLAGHSFGGQDLTTIGANSPERAAGLIYLNSAEDPTLKLSDYGVKPPDTDQRPPATPAADKSSFAAYRRWQLRNHGVAFPESELRQLYAVNPDGTLGDYLVPKSVRDAMAAGLRKPEYTRIRVPVLAFFAVPRDADDQMNRAIVKRHIQDLRKGVPGARIVELPGANFYIFLSNEAELVREINSFMAEVRQGR